MRPRAVHADERGIVASFLIKVILGLVLAGTVLIEGGSIMFTKLRVQDVAESAATAGAGSLTRAGNCTDAGDAAAVTAHDRDSQAKLRSYECHQGGRFTVVITKRAETLYVHLIGFLERFTLATARVTADPPSADV
ncbi:MAG: pilus assembly protein TadG-related protein [Actinomycetota bacterium]